VADFRSAPVQLVVPELVTLAGGTFVMGSDNGRPDERPAHPVELAPFRVATDPVTNEAYAACVRERGVAPPPWLSAEGFDHPRQPVVGVSWFEATAYCEWLAVKTGIPFRLPTEAEREYAALGGFTTRDWPWEGDNHPIAGEIAAANGPHIPHAECANGYGLRCMAENVHEWCSDWYDAGYYASSPAAAPAGPLEGVRKASRGGAWRHSVKFTRLAARSSLPPEYRYNDYGFRMYADI
jgi:formylglycine-generating enzyme required for sulfatase activity